MTVHFPNATGKAEDLATLRTLYQQALDCESRGLFSKSKSYFNACMAMILSKRVIINGAN